MSGYTPLEAFKELDVIMRADRLLGFLLHRGGYRLEWQAGQWDGLAIERILHRYGIHVFGRWRQPPNDEYPHGTLYCYVAPNRGIQAWHVLRGCGVPMVTPEPQAQAWAKPARARRQLQTRQRRGNLLDSLVDKIMR